MKNIKKYFAVFTLGISLVLTGCSGSSDEASLASTNMTEMIGDNSTNNSSDKTTTEDKTTSDKTTSDKTTADKTSSDKTTEDITEEATAEVTEEQEETTEYIIETTEEMTTAYVEKGETNENGVVDGQQAGPVETVATQASSNGGIISDKPYLIKVNRQANCVTVYQKDASGQYTVPVRAMVCSCGRAGMETPLGTFQLMMRYQWRELFGGVYGYYSTRVVGSILFHSVPYMSPSPTTLENWEYDKLGGPASQGCIRLQVKDSKWIFDNCATGTYVIIYDSADPGPLGKPEAPKIGNAYGVYKGWDPTDPTGGNPWNICNSWISLKATEFTCNLGDNLDVASFATGYDSVGNGVPVTVSGNVDTTKAGEYKVVYTVNDALGRSFSAATVFTVKDKENKVKDLVVETKSELFVGDKVSIKDFNITVKFDDGSTLKNPTEVKLDVSEIKSEKVEITVSYKDFKKKINIVAGKKPAETTVATTTAKETTTVAPTTLAPTTVAPTTVVPTTATPTTAPTVAPTTTEAPTTEEITTEATTTETTTEEPTVETTESETIPTEAEASEKSEGDDEAADSSAAGEEEA